jgi:hypothetical protein
MTAAPFSSPASRFLSPSVRDIIFIFLFWSLLAGPLSNRPLADPDIGWHIRNGEQILATHRLPHTDPFSSTMQGQPWFAWEWLYDLLLGIVHHAAGLNGVVWLCALLVAGVFALLLSQMVQRGTGLLLAIVLMLLAEATSAIHLFARPHIVSWFFTLVWFVQLEPWELWDRTQQGKIPRWILWFFPVSMMLWVNIHGGWLFGMALLAIYAGSAWVESWQANDPFSKIRANQRARNVSVAWLLAALATLANPFGWRLHAHVYSYLTDRYLINHIDEFRSPNFHGWSERCLAIILTLALIAFASDRTFTSTRTNETRDRLRLSNLLVVLLSVYAGFYASRNLPISAMLLVLVAGPRLWKNIAGLATRPGAWFWLRAISARSAQFSDRVSAQEMQLTVHLWPVAAVVLALFVCLHGGYLGSRRWIDASFDATKIPVEAVNFLQTREPNRQTGAGPIFSTDTWGGYLIYRLYPTRKVVMDDRHDLYGSSRVRQYLILMQGENGWRDVLKDWDIQTALLPADSTATNLLRELPSEWNEVYADKVAVVFVRR